MKIARVLSWTLLGLLGGWYVLCVTSFVDDRWRHFVDSALYVLTAKSLAAGEGYVYQGQPFFLRPPGLSWVLSFVEPDALAPRSMHLVIQGSAVAAVVAVMLAMRRLHGSVMGLVVALLVAVSPLTTGAFNKIFSGLPFLALLFAGAWLVMPGRDGRQVGLWRGFAGAVLLAASLWMRSIGLLILPGLVLVDVFRKEGRRWQGAALAAVVFVLWVPWVSWASSAAAEAPRPSTQLGLFDYQSAMFHVDKRDPDSALVDPDGWMARLVENVDGITETVGVVLVGTAEGPFPGLATLLLAAAILFTWWRRRSLLDWYALTYCIVMLLYFTFVDRLLLGLVPMIYSSLLYSVEELSKLWASGDQASRKPIYCVGLFKVLAPTRLTEIAVIRVGGAQVQHIQPGAVVWVRRRGRIERHGLFLHDSRTERTRCPSGCLESVGHVEGEASREFEVNRHRGMRAPILVRTAGFQIAPRWGASGRLELCRRGSEMHEFACVCARFSQPKCVTAWWP